MFALARTREGWTARPRQKGQAMEVLYPVVAGMDVHRDTVVVTVLKALPHGRVWQETRTFATFTDDLGRSMVS